MDRENVAAGLQKHGPNPNPNPGKTLTLALSQGERVAAMPPSPQEGRIRTEPMGCYAGPTALRSMAEKRVCSPAQAAKRRPSAEVLVC
jgi:hypothetical protein